MDKTLNIIIARDLGGKSSTGIEVLKYYHHIKSTAHDFIFISAFTEIHSEEIYPVDQRYLQVPLLLKKLFLILFKIDFDAIIDGKQFKKLIQRIQKSHRQFKVFGITSSTDFFVIYQMRKLTSKLGNQVLSKRLHFFDPIPAKEHWGENVWLRKAKIKLTKKLIFEDSIFSAASKGMCDYLADLYQIKVDLKYSSVPENTLLFIPCDNRVKKRAYYLGSIYGLRNSQNLLEAFACQNDWELFVFGENQKVEAPHVYFEDFKIDLSELECPDLFIDLDIDRLDVYIPGKSYTYLCTEIPILTITPEHSVLRTFYTSGLNQLNSGFHPENGIYFSENKTSSILDALIFFDQHGPMKINRTHLRENINFQYFGRDLE